MSYLNPRKAGLMAIEIAIGSGASYADYRQVHTQTESLSYSDGKPEDVSKGRDTGYGVRVLYEGAWGYCSSADLTEAEVRKTAETAVRIARASAILQKNPVILSKEKPFFDDYITPFQIDPFKVSLSDKLDFLAKLDALMGAYEGISSHSAFMDFRKITTDYFNSENTVYHQAIIQSGTGASVSAMRSHRERLTRSYPSNEGQFATKGFELLQEIDYVNQIPVLCEEAIAGLDADPCPEKVCDIVLDGSHVSLVIHESIGHPLELDRVFNSERNFSGTSFATPEKLDSLKYGSDIINVVNDPTAEFGLGTFGFDDEGVRAHKSDLIKNGVLVNYISSRESAARINKTSTGGMRADGWGNTPIVRMTNTNLLPGDQSFDDLIGGIDDGIYMKTSDSWSIDDTRENFQFGCQIGWEIKGGKLGKMIKNPTYAGNTVEFWNSCDGIGDKTQWLVWGTPNCGKGQPGQNGRVGQGASPARFRQVKVGV